VNPSQHNRTHELAWDGPLQNCLDDSLNAGECAVLESHLEGCRSCSGRLDDLRRIDAALRRSIGRPGLDESFDRRLLGLIDAQASG
jgi:anti-sigma factor RsiW